MLLNYLLSYIIPSACPRAESNKFLLELFMNILMIYPRYPVTFWSFKYALKYVSKKAAFPPLGLLTVAAILPEDWNIRLVDLNICKLRDRDLQWADYVMISAMLVQKESVSEILKQCTRLGKKIIAGGPLFNASVEEYLPFIDHLILNEAEFTLPEFLKDLEKGNPKKVYHSSDFPSLSLTPIPRWNLIDVRNYSSLMVQYSRGCPYDCEFCNITAIYGRRPRLKGIDQFLRELQSIYDRGWRGSLFIVDDNFIGNRIAIKKMLPHVIEWMKNHDYPFEFFTEASINIVDDEKLVHLMVEAGFKQVFIGLETPNEESLKECSKNHNCNRDLITAIKKLQTSGLAVFGGYIVGFDSDDEDIFDRQIKFIQESGVVTAMVGLLSALPNTRLWHRLKNDNRLEAVASGDNTDGSINFIPKMDSAKLIDGYRRIIKTIYSPKYYYQRICQFLRYYNPDGKRKVGSDRIMAFLRSILYIGILGNGITQMYYWRLFIKALIFYRRSFKEVITLMIYGEHFRKVAKKICS
jgi:radical SAM superfamily enzyme YgiQ (UPF0313 family)